MLLEMAVGDPAPPAAASKGTCVTPTMRAAAQCPSHAPGGLDYLLDSGGHRGAVWTCEEIAALRD
jgi:hypothetical protein